MQLKQLTGALLLLSLPLSSVCAAALDRSGQSLAGFLQPNNYFEAGISVLDPSVSGKDTAGNNASDMANDYYFPHAVLKLQPTERVSVGLIYDQPFGADATYSGQNNFVSTTSDVVLAGTSLTQGLPVVTGQPNYVDPNSGLPLIVDPTTGQPQAIALNSPTTGGTTVDVQTQNLNFLVGFQPTENWNLYGGAVYQTLKADVKLRGPVYSLFNGYDLNIPEDAAVGWLAGVAYQIPKIALKASLTYRSEVEHEFNAKESLPLVDPMGQLLVKQGAITPEQLQGLKGSGKTKATTPQSVNLDLQSGIMANTIAFANIRWVDWSSFSIRPYQFGQLSQLAGGILPIGKPNGFNLVDYSDDQWSATVGVGRKMSDLWSGSVSVGWDSGAGNPVTTLGPTEGFWNVGLGLQYSPTPSSFIAGGVKYLWLGDAKAQTGAHSAAGNFTDNDALAYGLKIGHRF